MTAANAEHGHQELVRRIRSAGEHWKRRAAWLGLVRLLALVVAAVAAVLVLEGWFGLSPSVRVTLLSAVGLLLLVGAAVWVVRPLTRRVDPVDLAARIEERLPDLGERLESSAELWDKREKGRHNYSVELIDALILKTVAESAGVDFRIDPSARQRRGVLRTSGVLLALSVLGVATLGPRLGPSVARLSRPLVAVERPIVTITVEPGDVTLVSGDDLGVTARLEGPYDGLPAVVYELDGERPSTQVMAPLSKMDAGAVHAPFRAVVAGVRSDMTYFVQVGDVSSETYDVRVVERPFVAGLRLDYEFPRYTGLVARTVDENSGDITALTGTRVRVTVTASKPIERGELTLESGERVRMESEGSTVLAAPLVVREDTSYSIELLDTDGLANPDPPVYSIVAIRDERPLVRIVEPGEDTEAPRGMVLPLTVSAVDDYGISELTIRYSLEGSAEEGVMRLEAPGTSGPREMVREVSWDLSETGLLPGRSLVYYAEVTDNDRVTGPKSSRSESYVVRFPSMSELYSEVTGEQDDLMFELGEILEEQEELREQFEDIQEEFRSEPEINWQDEQEVESALERQEDIADDVVRMADELSELSDTMSETDRITLDTLEKVEEITSLLDEVATEEMRELLESIRQAMERVSPEDVSEAMEMVSVTQDDYLKRLEQTLNLLRRAQAEQQLADVAERTEQLASLEEQLAREAEQSPGSEACQAMAQEQERLQAELEQLRKDLAEAAENMNNVDPSAARQMEAALSEMEANETAGKMEDARRNFADSKPSEAGASCESAASDLLTLFTKLSQCQGGMACSIQARDRDATLRAIDELLGVSAEQEEIVGAVEERTRIPRAELVELVAKETDLVESMSAIADRMFQVSKDSYVIDPSIFRAFGNVQMMMTRAASHIADGGSAAGHKEARAALGSINSLVVSLLTSNQSSSSSGGSAMQQLMQQLQQMGQQQSELNQMTEELRSQMEQMGMSDSFERQLAEMRGRQERILEEARRIAREFGDRREILGRLDDTVAEMEGTLEEMQRSGASQETVDRQKRILSRLLDAQRSLRRRDHTRERMSRSAREFSRTAPGELPPDVARVTQELREDLLRAMQKGYPTEYRELIRAYFRGLSEDAAPVSGDTSPDAAIQVDGESPGDGEEASP